MGYTCNVDWEALRSLDTSTMSSSSTYYAVGGPLLHPSYKLKMVNNSNVLARIRKLGRLLQRPSNRQHHL